MSSDHSTLSTIPKLIARVLELEEVPVREIFQRADISYDDVINNSDRVPMDKMQDLWKHAAEATNDPCFGLLAASVFQPAYLKGIGLAWVASNTLGEGLERFINNIGMVNTAAKLDLSRDGDEVILRYMAADAVPALPVTAHPCAIQLGLGFLLRMFRLAACRPVPISKAYFKHHIPKKHVSRYQDFFECEINDQYDFNGLAFQASVLEEPLPAADKELAALNDQSIGAYMKSLAQSSIAKRVCDCIAPLLPSGCPTESEIAIRLNMSKRTLQRKLAAAGTSYGNLQSSLRNDLAKAYLKNSNSPITEIAYQLGYSSPSTFARAFKQSNRMTPNEFREQSN